MRAGRRAAWLAVVVVLGLGPGRPDTVESQLSKGAVPYGCWAIADQVERLACFDLALGPPPMTAQPDPGCSDPQTSSCGPGGGSAVPAQSGSFGARRPGARL